MTEGEVSTEEDSLNIDLGKIEMKLETQQVKRKLAELEKKVEASKGFLRGVERIKPELLDREFLVSLPSQILEMFDDRRTKFDEMEPSSDSRGWGIAKKSKKHLEKQVNLNELEKFLKGFFICIYFGPNTVSKKIEKVFEIIFFYILFQKNLFFLNKLIILKNRIKKSRFNSKSIMI